jgi:TetR/AcrR family transcriptional repressor of nem operon
MGRTSDARERLIDAGRRLLGERSYGSIGVAEISATAGAPKGSFYYFFPSKQEFAVAVIDDHWQSQEKQWSDILGAAEPVVRRLRRLFEATAEVQRRALTDTGAVAGCMFGNLALELSSSEPMVKKRLQEIFDAQVLAVRTAMSDAESGLDATEEELDELATAVVANLEGLVLLAKLHDDPSRIEAQWNTTERMLGAATAEAGS